MSTLYSRIQRDLALSIASGEYAPGSRIPSETSLARRFGVTRMTVRHAVDGLIRDLPGIKEIGFPVYARGTTVIGPLHRGPGEINYPISCGGVVINPGDVIVADEAGMVAVPQDVVLSVVTILMKQQEENRSYLAAVKRGAFTNEWVDNLLERHHCPVYPPAEATAGEPAPPTEESLTIR